GKTSKGKPSIGSFKDGSLHEVLKNFPDHQQLAASAKPYFGNIEFDNALTLNTIYYWYASMEMV
ncbi:MAG: hypothetical protein EBW18_08465, partial [Burkholderiaceae bacterium]|nr:hypothetical protein [Burkholderiaceae bacterium]